MKNRGKDNGLANMKQYPKVGIFENNFKLIPIGYYKNAPGKPGASYFISLGINNSRDPVHN